MNLTGTRTEPVRAVALLGWREGRRMLASPAYLLIVGVLLLLTVGVATDLPRGRGLPGRVALQGYLGMLITYGALATLFAASLVASSARRTGADGVLDAAPVDPQLRTLATGLGVLLGPVGVASLLTLLLWYVEHGITPPLPVTLRAWEYVQLPLIVLGAGLLGLAAARWVPWPGVPLALFTALIAWTMWSANSLYRGGDAGFLMPYVISRQDVIGFGTATPLGWPGWHAWYLLGLCLLALAAALWRHRPLRERTVLGFAVLAALLTVSAAWMQLPP